MIKYSAGLPSKPGNWKLLGIRSKYDPVTNIPIGTIPSIMPEAKPATEKSGVKPGRPPGMKNKRKPLKWLPKEKQSDAPGTLDEFNDLILIHDTQDAGSSAGEGRECKGTYNILGDVQDEVRAFMTKIKSDVMTQCHWSITKYYRKQLPQTRISNAEIEMIGIVVGENLLLLNSHLTDLIKRCRKNKFDKK